MKKFFAILLSSLGLPALADIPYLADKVTLSNAIVTVAQTVGGGGAASVDGPTISATLEGFSKPTSGYTWSQFPTPQLMFDTWSTFGAINGSLYVTNVQGWITNLAGTLYTNGLAARMEPWIAIDDGWQATNLLANGSLIENSNIFPIGMREVIRRVHNMGSRVVLYSSIGTNTCASLAGSPTNYLRQHVFNMLDMGADGAFFDMCDGVPSDRATLRAAVRIANLAVREYQSLLYSTQGVVRPMYLSFVTGNGSITPGEQLLDSEFLTGANSLSWNWSDQFESLRSSVTKAKETIRYLGPFIQPGFAGDAARVYDTGVAGFWPEALSLQAMSCQQLRTGAGDSQVGRWTNAVYSGSGYGEGYEYFQMTNVFLRWFTPELLSVWKDPLVVPAKIVRTNDLAEVWQRPLVNGGRAVLTFNLASTNYAQVISVKDFGGASNVIYEARAPLYGTNVATFTNAFSYTVGSSNAILFTIRPVTYGESVATSEQTKSWAEVNVTGTGTTKQTTTQQIGDARWSGGNEGLYQSAANQSLFFNLPAPWYATQAVVRLFCSSAYTGAAVSWTNNIVGYYSSPVNRVTENGPSVGVIVPDGQATWLTLTVAMTRTNCPKEIVITQLASTNASARLIVGGVHYTFYGTP